MEIKTAIALLAMLISASARLHAQSSDHAKVINLTSSEYAGAPIVVPNGNAPIAIATSGTNWIMTVGIDDIAYSFNLRQTRKVKTRDFIVGDFVAAHVEKDKMVVRLPDGREAHGKIVRRERLSTTPAQTSSATRGLQPAPE